jgi:hypothetical protein
MNVSAVRQPVFRIVTRLRQYRANAFFCDARHSETRRTQLGSMSIQERSALANTPKGDTHAYPVRHRDRSRSCIHRLVSRTDRWQNPFLRFPRPTRHDGHHGQSAASALPRLQHHLLMDRAVGSSICGLAGPCPPSPGRFPSLAARAALLTPTFTAAQFIPTMSVKLQCTDLSGRKGSKG